MEPKREQCQLCELEGHQPQPESEEKEGKYWWDGKSYPSFRRNRTVCPEPENYTDLYRAVNGLLYFRGKIRVNRV